MAGKKKTAGTQSKGWGGSRKGSGRKNNGPEITDTQVKNMLKRAKKWAKDEGRDIDDILISFIYGKQGEGWKMTVRDRLAAIDLFKKYTMTKKTEKDINIKESVGPAIGLPPTRPDPSKIVSIEGGRKG